VKVEGEEVKGYLLALGLLRPLRGSAFGLGQPDAFGAGESRADDCGRQSLQVVAAKPQ